MWRLVWQWVETQMLIGTSSGDRNAQWFVNVLRFPYEVDSVRGLRLAIDKDEDQLLDLIDALLRFGAGDSDGLEKILDGGGSAWRVAPNSGGLINRVPEEALASYEQVLAHGNRAGDHLSGAWRHAFGRSPDAGEAWSDAVKAVEAVLHEVVEPKNEAATLGTMKRVLRDAPQGKFVAHAPGSDPLDSVRSMLAVLPYEDGRHGSDQRVPTLEVARVAVLQATAITAAMGEGMLKRA